MYLPASYNPHETSYSSRTLPKISENLTQRLKNIRKTKIGLKFIRHKYACVNISEEDLSSVQKTHVAFKMQKNLH